MAMSKSVRYLIPLVVFAALAGLLVWGLGQDPREVPSPLIGKPVPTFSLPTLEDPNRAFTDADLRGKVSLVNVWASWCSACRAEHQSLMALSEMPGFQLIGLNWKDDAADAKQVLAISGDPYTMVGYDPDNKVGIDWGVYGAPETFVVDRQGIIRYKQIGPIDRKAWEEKLQPLLEKLNAEG
ncbi:MAG: DsbE family thiol:disulfide interchange protein [Thiohalocapsa sp.]|jgi:cytochrome c biogenesis protein CcmG/thiol:disulfide interchange protein DsbE|uniref:DsbE family thiol:disulfide interchange protein n=1 Tax=Thiohalocapsa sp. TaxID=2497641 RepID=UPI0025FE377C|nr:DsbE family thiol:disulfide interchange protein [Thiohalocapsa sp.]MCG6940531.1 DsbE family thiol:disulfide interchange protein [Thiohalocapsa sp.]